MGDDGTNLFEKFTPQVLSSVIKLMLNFERMLEFISLVSISSSFVSNR